MKSLRTMLISLTALFCCTGTAMSQMIQVTAGDPNATLQAAIDFANTGNADTLMLMSDGTVPYELAPVEILSPMTIMAAPGLASMPVIRAAAGIAQNDYITVDNDLTVNGVMIDGQTIAGDFAAYKYMFKVNNVPENNPINPAPKLRVMNSHLRNVYANGDPTLDQDGNFFDISRTSYAELVHFENTTLENSGDEGIRSINTHKDPVHPNNAAIGELIIRNCTFNNINGSAIKIEDDGDSTTVDGKVLVENVTFYNCQRRVIWERDAEGTIFRNLIIANSKTGNDTFGGTDVLISFQRRGSVVAHVDTFMIERIAGSDTVTLGNQPFFTEGGRWSGSSDEGYVDYSTIYGFDPMFADAANGDFTLLAGSKAYGRAHDGGAIGDRRWATNPPAAGVAIMASATDPNATLDAALAFANAGNADTIMLATDGLTAAYELTPLAIDHPMVIMPAPGLASPPIIRAAAGIDQNDFIRVNEDLTVKGVIIDGQTVAGDYAKFKYMFKINNVPENNPINDAPSLRVYDSHLRNVYRNGDPALDTDGNFLDIQRTGYAGALHFENVTFENSGDEALRSINAHKDPVHPKNGGFQSLVVKNSTFININGSAIKIESDGDSTTVDAPVLIENVTFYNCLRRVIWERDFENSIFRNLIIANSKIGNDTFGGTDALISFQRRGSVVSHVDTFMVERIVDGDTVTIGPDAFPTKGGDWSNSSDAGTVIRSTIYGFDPMFADPENGDFTLMPGSEAYGKGYDGQALGDLRWATNPPTSVVESGHDLTPEDYTLSQNYPNPFNPSTTIRYNLQNPSQVKIQVFDITGRLVETLIDGRKAAGAYTIQWIPDNVSSGLYFYRMLIDGRNVETRKMTLLK